MKQYHVRMTGDSLNETGIDAVLLIRARSPKQAIRVVEVQMRGANVQLSIMTDAQIRAHYNR